MTTATRARIDVYEHVTDRIIEKLEQGVVPWHCPWKTSDEMPHNLRSKKQYRGVNLFLLGLDIRYESPYWLTFKQAKDLGGSVRRGEKSTLVVFWKLLETNDKGTGEKINIPILRHYRVFSTDQCDLPAGKVPEVEQAKNEHTPIEMCERVIAEMVDAPEIRHGAKGACYLIDDDTVHMPNPERFETPESYYASLFHELSHSTGARNRLDRDMGAFGSTAYGREELVAEMAAAFLCGHCGIEQRHDASAAYLQGWIRILKGDKKLAIQAAGAAQKAADRILGTTFDDEE